MPPHRLCGVRRLPLGKVGIHVDLPFQFFFGSIKFTAGLGLYDSIWRYTRDLQLQLNGSSAEKPADQETASMPFAMPARITSTTAPIGTSARHAIAAITRGMTSLVAMRKYFQSSVSPLASSSPFTSER